MFSMSHYNSSSMDKRPGPMFKRQWHRPAPQSPMLLLKTLFPFLFFCKEIIVSVIIYSSLFTIQSVKMSNKNKYQCYSSWSIQYDRSLPFLIEMLSEMQLHLGIFPEIWLISCSCQCGLFLGWGHSSWTNEGERSLGLERIRDASQRLRMESPCHQVAEL